MVYNNFIYTNKIREVNLTHYSYVIMTDIMKGLFCMFAEDFVGHLEEGLAFMMLHIDP